MTREIIRLGNPILREPVGRNWREGFDDDAVATLAADMTDTMREANGVGIAAPQLGEAARLIALETREGNRYGVTELFGLTLVLDPEIEVVDSQTVVSWEGCLSLPALRGPVVRSQEIVLRGTNLEGAPLERRLSGFAAIVAQHEVDHIEGVLFIDRMANLELLSFESEFERYHRPDSEPPAGLRT